MVSQAISNKTKRNIREKWKLLRKLDCLHEGQRLFSVCSLLLFVSPYLSPTLSPTKPMWDRYAKKCQQKVNYVEMWLHKRYVALLENERCITITIWISIKSKTWKRWLLRWRHHQYSYLFYSFSRRSVASRTGSSANGCKEPTDFSKMKMKEKKTTEKHRDLRTDSLTVSTLSHKMNTENSTPSCEITSTVTDYVPILIKSCMRPPVVWSLVCHIGFARTHKHTNNNNKTHKLECGVCILRTQQDDIRPI